MRRGIGVGHIVQKKQHKDNMADLGAMMTAERISRLADQLEDLTSRLKELTLTHLHEIESDAIVRAKFRQLADSLGADFSDLLREAAEEHRRRSHSKGPSPDVPRSSGGGGGDTAQTLFSKILSIVDGSTAEQEQQEMLRLGCEAIQMCILERRYVGAFVPLASIVGHLRRKYKANHIPFHYRQSANRRATTTTTISVATSPVSVGDHGSLINEDVVREALRMVTDVFGAASGYACIEMEGIGYVQSLAGASTGSATDALTLITAARTLQQHPTLARAPGEAAEAEAGSTSGTSSNGASRNANYKRVLGMHAAAGTLINRAHSSSSSLPADARLSESPQQSSLTGAMVPCCTKEQLHAQLPHWPMHRLDAALGGLMSDGSVWIDHHHKGANSETSGITPTVSRYWFLDRFVGLLMNT
jgi:ESCRT-II complex subunit VPS22